MKDERVARPERQRRYDELFDLIESVLDDPEIGDLDPTEAAQSAAETLGLPWKYTPSIGHLDICLDAMKPRRFVSWLPWPHRSFESLGRKYVCVTYSFDHRAWKHQDGRRMRPMIHEYMLR